MTESKMDRTYWIKQLKDQTKIVDDLRETIETTKSNAGSKYCKEKIYILMTSLADAENIVSLIKTHLDNSMNMSEKEALERSLNLFMNMLRTNETIKNKTKKALELSTKEIFDL